MVYFHLHTAIAIQRFHANKKCSKFLRILVTTVYFTDQKWISKSVFYIDIPTGITFRTTLFEYVLGTIFSTNTKIFTWMHYYDYSKTYEIRSVFHILFARTYLSKLGQNLIHWSGWIFKCYSFDDLWSCFLLFYRRSFFWKSFILRWQLVALSTWPHVFYRSDTHFWWRQQKIINDALLHLHLYLWKFEGHFISRRYETKASHNNAKK